MAPTSSAHLKKASTLTAAAASMRRDFADDRGGGVREIVDVGRVDGEAVDVWDGAGERSNGAAVDGRGEDVAGVGTYGARRPVHERAVAGEAANQWRLRDRNALGAVQAARRDRARAGV